MALEKEFSFLSTFLSSKLFTCGRIFHAGCLSVCPETTQWTFSEVLPASQTPKHPNTNTQTPRHPNTNTNTNIETVATPWRMLSFLRFVGEFVQSRVFGTITYRPVCGPQVWWIFIKKKLPSAFLLKLIIYSSKVQYTRLRPLLFFVVLLVDETAGTECFAS